MLYPFNRTLPLWRKQKHTVEFSLICFVNVDALNYHTIITMYLLCKSDRNLSVY